MGGSGQALALRNYNGGIKLTNKTGPEAVSIDLNSGQIILENTVTNGEIVCRGIGKLTDNSNGATVYSDDLLRSGVISRAVWDESIADHKVAGSFGDELATKADIRGAVSTIYHSSSAGVIVYGSNVSGSYSDTDTRNNVYWQIQENASTGLTVEFTFNIVGENKPGDFSIFGRYEGVPSSTHFINLQAYNYEAAGWEILATGFMPGGNTSDLEFKHEYYERNIDRDNNNEVKIRLVHNVTTYSASHNLYIDSAILSCLEVVSAEEIASAVWNDANALAVLSDLAFIKSIEGGRWHIVGNEMIFYQDDNTTEIARFTLSYDVNGNPDQRVRT
jgi:hypothetical protein